MINTNGVLGHRINLDELYRLMLKNSSIPKDQISRPNDRVTLLHRIDTHTTSIFLFHTGSYMITGGKNHIHIRGAFEFMMGIIEPVWARIVLPDEDIIDDVANSEQFKHFETV
jgi:TATA-box binding protein (TBP) (component of TFIID and TFIIIB)